MEPKQVDLKITPDEAAQPERTYANFCAVEHSPFDFTLSFCDVPPFNERALREAQQTGGVLRAPVRARLAIPVQMMPGLIAALQENLRIYHQSFAPPPPATGPAN